MTREDVRRLLRAHRTTQRHVWSDTLDSCRPEKWVSPDLDYQ